ncbi:Chitin deacetylase [Paramyrothecium foliicola]|nr:Chitin deacetylase [Paramyrothecium foliicola]
MDRGVPKGTAIFHCLVPGTMALTFDDDPFVYTNQTLDLLAEAGIRATFFVNGNTWGDIDEYHDIIRRMKANGHQIASHTYDHSDLLTLNDAEIIETMRLLEEELIDIIGAYPTYMRPPAFQYDNSTLKLLGALGYHVIDADLDTYDYIYSTVGDTTSLDIFDQGLRAGKTIALAHVNTAEILLPSYIQLIQDSGLRPVTVGECLGDPEVNWYRQSRKCTPTATDIPSTISITSTETPTGIVNANNLCGGPENYVCSPGDCCSQFGVCGSARFHCLSGCQSEFGVCGISVASPSQLT